MPSKRDRSASDADASSKKIKSAKTVSSDSKIRASVPELKTSEEGEKYWELSAKRRVTVSKFKGATFVNLREFYEKDGKSLPGKQGIALNVEQFAVLVKAIPAIQDALAEQGIEFADGDDNDDEEEQEDDGEQEEQVKGRAEKGGLGGFVVDDDEEE